MNDTPSSSDPAADPTCFVVDTSAPAEAGPSDTTKPACPPASSNATHPTSSEAPSAETPSASSPGGTIEAFESPHLRKDLLRATGDHRDKRAMLTALAAIVSEHISPEATLYIERDSSNAMLPASLLAGNASAASDEFQPELLAQAESACERGHLVAGGLGDSSALVVLSVPVFLRGCDPEVFLGVFVRGSSALEDLSAALEMVAAHVTLWCVSQDAKKSELEAESAAALHELLAKMEGSRNVREAASTMVNELQGYFKCHRVVLALSSRGRSRLAAISGVKSYDKHTPFTYAAESALDEVVLRGRLTVWPPLTPGDRHAALAHQRLLGLAEVECVVSSPLRDERGEVVGAWMFLGTKQCFEQPGALAFLRASEKRVASCLALLERSGRGIVAKWGRWLLKKSRSWKTAVGLLGVLAIVGLLLVPMPYKIGCNCRLEPVARRFVAAPYDGILEKVLVGSGAVVSQGDLLARMEDREIRWELAGATAERDRAAKQRDMASARHNFAAAEIARLEVEQLELKIRLLEHRQENLDVNSPVDGSVTVGDLDKSQGAPVSSGQTLFEIAPLDAMIVEVGVPERDMPFVGEGLEVVVHLDAYPSRPYRGAIERIHPRAEIREHENVFIAEVLLKNPEGALRPGMQGRAKVVGPRRALGWNLFHKAWESVRQWLGW